MPNEKMNANNLSIEELQGVIRDLEPELSPDEIKGAIFLYMDKLLHQSNLSPIYPNHLIPLPKFKLKEWGKQYAEGTYKRNKELSETELEFALLHCKFREIPTTKWDLIKKGSVDNYKAYILDVHFRGKSDLPLDAEIKQLLDDYFNEYQNGKKALMKKLHRQKIGNLLRWVLFIPVSTMAAETAKFLINKLNAGLLTTLLPALGETISGIFSWTCTSVVLIFVAYKIVPDYKKTTIKIYATSWTVLMVGWTFFTWFLSKEGIAGSFWFPLLLNISFVAGLWGTYVNLFLLNDQEARG